MPVVPLDYFDPARGTWRPVVRWAAWLVTLRAALDLLVYLFDVGCFAYQESGSSRFRVNLVLGWPLVFDVPAAAISVFMVFGAISLLRDRPLAHRRVVRLLAIQCVVGPVTMTATGVYRNGYYSYIATSLAFQAYYASLYIGSGVYSALIPAALAVLLARPEAKAISIGADSGNRHSH